MPGTVRTLSVSALLVLAGLAVAAPAGAAERDAAAPQPSQTFAGYQVTSTTLKTVTASLKVPIIACTKQQRGFQNGIVMNGTNALGPFTFGEYTAATVWSYCQSGQKVQQAVIYLDGTAVTKRLTVKGGDLVNLSLTETTKTLVASIADTSAKKTLRKVGKALAAYQSTNAQIGTQPLNNGSSAQLPVPSFSHDNYSKVLVNGAPLGAATPAAFTWVRGSTAVVKTGALVGKGAFVLAFAHH